MSFRLFRAADVFVPALFGCEQADGWGDTRMLCGATQIAFSAEDPRWQGIIYGPMPDSDRERIVTTLLAAAAAGRSRAAGAARGACRARCGGGRPVLRARHRPLAADAPDAAWRGRWRWRRRWRPRGGGGRGRRAGRACAAADRGRGQRGYDGRLLALARYLVGRGASPRDRAAGRVAPAAREGADHLALEDHLARAAADGCADPGLRAEELAREALLQMSRVERIDGAEQVAGQALAAAAAAGPDAERRAPVVLAWARIMRGRAVEMSLSSSNVISTTRGLRPITYMECEATHEAG